MVELVDEMRPEDKRKLAKWFWDMSLKIAPANKDVRLAVQGLKLLAAEMETEGMTDV